MKWHYQNVYCTKTGLSLVELLVAIGVMSVLGLILFAGFRKAVTASQRIECASNMRQVWQGTLLYVAEHQGMLPKDGGTIDYGPKWLDGQYTGAVGKLANLLSPYVGDEAWYCPDPLAVDYFESQSELGRVWRQRPLAGWASGSPYNRKRSEEQDLLVNWDDLSHQYVFMCQPLWASARPHDGNLNVLAMDGHVETWDYQ